MAEPQQTPPPSPPPPERRGLTQSSLGRVVAVLWKPRETFEAIAASYKDGVLTLSLPKLDANPAHPPETRTARVSAWLGEIGRRDPVAAAQLMGDALAATNRVDMSDARRMELAGLTLLREYALFVAVPVSALGWVVGRLLGCRR